jgi:hypothetical protein
LAKVPFKGTLVHSTGETYQFQGVTACIFFHAKLAPLQGHGVDGSGACDLLQEEWEVQQCNKAFQISWVLEGQFPSPVMAGCCEPIGV